MDAVQAFFRAAARSFLLLLASGIVFFLLYRTYTTNRIAEVTQRNYRFLGATGSQLVLQISAWELSTTMPHLETITKCVRSEDPTAGNEARISVSGINTPRRPSRDELLVRLTGMTCDLGSTIRDAVVKQDFFDVVMLATKNGKVLYDLPSSGTP
jgi:hypothetical protein